MINNYKAYRICLDDVTKVENYVEALCSLDKYKLYTKDGKLAKGKHLAQNLVFKRN